MADFLRMPGDRFVGISGVPYDAKEVMIGKVVHAIWILAGALLLYAGIFLTETEEGRLRNRLEELWIRVDDLRSKAMNLQVALLRQTAGLVADGFTQVFGEKLISVTSVASCLCFSIASLYLSLALFVGEVQQLSQTVLLTCALIFFALGFSRKLRYAGFAVLAFSVAFELIGLRGSLKVYQSSPQELAFGTLFYTIAILIGIGFIALTRWSMRLASHLTSTSGLIGIILWNITVSAALVAPLIYTYLLSYHVSVFGPRTGPSLVSRPHRVLIFLYDVSVSNLFTALAAFVIVLAILAALFHQLAWPIISRPIYAAQRFGLISQHQFLRALGVCCIFAALPNNPFVKAIAKLVHLGG